jgi:hypothetical protein
LNYNGLHITQPIEIANIYLQQIFHSIGIPTNDFQIETATLNSNPSYSLLTIIDDTNPTEIKNIILSLKKMVLLDTTV